MGIIPGPSVLPQYYGGDVGGKIADALSTYYQLNRQKQLDALQYGIGLKWPGADQGQGGLPSSSQAPIGVGDRIRAALSHVGIGSNPVPAEQAQWRLNQGSPTVGVTANSAQGGTAMDETPRAPSGRQAWDEQMPGGVGGMPDYMTLPNGQRIPTIMTPFGSRLLAAMKTRADIGLAGTEADKNSADAEYTRHKNVQPLPGDPNYVTTMQPIWGGKASTEAQAAYPYQAGLAGIRNQGVLGAAQIGAQSRLGVANIEQSGANTRQASQQGFERGIIVPKAQAGAQAAQSTEQYKEGGQIIPSVVRPINNLMRSLVGAQPLGTSPQASGTTTPLPSAKPTITTAERAALIAKGHAPADVDANYTVQGGPGAGSSW